MLTPQNPTVTVNLTCGQVNPPSPDHRLIGFTGTTLLTIPANGWLTFQNVTSAPVAVGSYAGVQTVAGPLPDGSPFEYRLNPYGGGVVTPSLVLAPGATYRVEFPANTQTLTNVFGYNPQTAISDRNVFLGTGTFTLPIQFFVTSNNAYYYGGPNQFTSGQLRIVDYEITLGLSAWPGQSWVAYEFETPEGSSIAMVSIGLSALALLGNSRRRLPRWRWGQRIGSR